MKNLFNKDYYENGIKKGISGYKDYRWIPTRSIPEAISICERIQFDSVLDFGCAKGFLVHALNLVSGKPIYGADISEYAIETSLPQIKRNLFLMGDKLSNLDIKVDLIIAKDVLEHIPEEEIDEIFEEFHKVCKKAFLVIPLGDNDSFRIREYEMDKTHVTKKDEEWWIHKIRKNGFRLESFSYDFGHVKEKWTKDHPYGNGFFIIVKEGLSEEEA